MEAKAKKQQNVVFGKKISVCFCLCPPSWKNDLNNVNIDDIRDISRVNRARSHGTDRIRNV